MQVFWRKFHPFNFRKLSIKAAWTLMYIVIWKSWGWSVERLCECPLIIALYGLEHITYPYASRKVKGTSQPNRQPKYQTRWSEDAPHPVKQLEQANEVDRGISWSPWISRSRGGWWKKNTGFFMPKKNGFPSTSRLDFFITDVCWASLRFFFLHFIQWGWQCLFCSSFMSTLPIWRRFNLHG